MLTLLLAWSRKGSALEGFKSYLSNKSFRVGEHWSPVSGGVSQGSILAHFHNLGAIFRTHGLSLHCYADETGNLL